MCYVKDGIALEKALTTHQEAGARPSRLREQRCSGASTTLVRFDAQSTVGDSQHPRGKVVRGDE